MKIQKLHIDSFRHLENVEFDFTYQTGERKGQPLDKICLIGQSATGKTSVLEFIKSGIQNNNLTSNKGYLNILTQDFLISNKPSENNNFQEIIGKLNKNLIYFFSSEILSPNNFNIFTQNFSKKTEQNNISVPSFPSSQLFNASNQSKFLKNAQPNKEQILQNLFNQRILEFNYNTNVKIWEHLLDEISVYRDKITQKGSELINKGFHLDYKRLEKEMEIWKFENPNPLVELSEKCLNQIFKKINLEVDLVNTSVAIPLKPINSDKAIPANALSTGTKQLLLTALPLFKLPTDNTMILIDEPERSLYPDMQIELMDYYKNLAPNAQFIVATHSPFIAAAFEPEERFILYFGEDGKVKIRNGVSPIGDDPNDILYNDFGLSSVINKAGEEAYKIYLEKKQQMIFEEDKAKKHELLKEVEEIGEKYNF